MKKIETNLELIIDLMDYSPYGAMSQIFIMDALHKQIDAVIENEAELLDQDRKDQEEAGNISFININAWIGTAKDLKKRIAEFHSRHERMPDES